MNIFKYTISKNCKYFSLITGFYDSGYQIVTNIVKYNYIIVKFRFKKSLKNKQLSSFKKTTPGHRFLK